MGRNFVSIGKRIQSLRESKGLSQEELSVLSKVSLRGIQNIEYGTVKSPGIETLYKLAKALKVLLEDIVDEEILTVMRKKEPIKSDMIVEIVSRLPQLNEKQLQSVEALIRTALQQSSAS